MAEIIYILCMLTSIACAALLIRSYLKTGTRLMLWASWAFACMAVNNLLLFMDKVVWPQPEVDFSASRTAVGAIGGLLLLYGLIRETVLGER